MGDIYRVDYGTVSGGSTLNPTALKYGYVASGGQVSQTIDLTKTYILSISSNASAADDYMDTFLIDKGQKSYLHDATSMIQDITISGTTLSFTNSSSASYRSYCLTQLD